MFGASASGGLNPNKDVQVNTPLGDSVSSLSWSPRANLLVATLWDNNVYCWDIQVRTPGRRGAPAVALQHLLAACWGGAPWRAFASGFLQSLLAASTLRTLCWRCAPCCCRALPGGTRGFSLASGCSTNCWLSPLITRSRLAPTPTPPQSNGTANPKASTNHTQPVLCSAWNADGTGVFTGGCDKMVKLWNLATNQSQQVGCRRCKLSVSGSCARRRQLPPLCSCR